MIRPILETGYHLTHNHKPSLEALQKVHLFIYFIYLFGVLRHFQHYTGHITTGSWKGRGNQYIEFARVVYCKLPTNGKQLPPFPLKAVMVLPFCHRGPLQKVQNKCLRMITWTSPHESSKPSHEILQLPYIQSYLEQCRTKALKRYEDSELQQHLSEVLEAV